MTASCHSCCMRPDQCHHQRGMVPCLLAAMQHLSLSCCMMRSNCHCLTAVGHPGCQVLQLPSTGGKQSSCTLSGNSDAGRCQQSCVPTGTHR